MSYSSSSKIGNVSFTKFEMFSSFLISFNLLLDIKYKIIFVGYTAFMSLIFYRESLIFFFKYHLNKKSLVRTHT